MYYSTENKLKKAKKETKPKNNVDYIYKTPKELKKYLDKKVVGQDAAKKIICVTFSNHLKRIIMRQNNYEKLYNVKLEKSNLLLVGPTGCGKTLLVKTLAPYIGLPFSLGDATSLTEAGYVGDDVETLISTLLKNTPSITGQKEPDIALAEKGVIFIDEVDKIAKMSQGQSVSRDVSGEGVQQALLKMVEGSIVRVQPFGSRKHPESDCIEIDTSNILFVAAGSFVGLDKIVAKRVGKTKMGFYVSDRENTNFDSIMPDDLIEFGIIPEFIGRFHNIEKLERLTKAQLKTAMTDIDNSIIEQYKALADFEDCTLEFTDDFIDMVADLAYELDVGARGLRQIMEKILSHFFYDLPKGKLVINQNKAKSVLGVL